MPLAAFQTLRGGPGFAQPATAHPIQRLLAAEDLVRRRRAGEYRRHVASQRAAKIDPNPHQIEAVIFALARLPDGGCILADEVGLGKTIEAGLVIAQLRAEGVRRILVVTPKALLGQWQQELFALFSIEAREVVRDRAGLDGDGVFLVTRDTIGSERGAARFQSAESFDLCIVDEAHEVFASIYRRFDNTGALRDDAPIALMAGRLAQYLHSSGTPVLLLTATPIQNSLVELWGLVHYVDPTGTLLGDLTTFRQLFCPTDDRILAEDQEHELQRRLGVVLQRTLRRQAQDFMSEPFVGRQARLFEYSMSVEERTLYDDVTNYLLEPNLCAFQGNQRALLLLGFHRRMASSHAALRASLENVADRLRALARGAGIDDAADSLAALRDLEDDQEVDAAASEPSVDRASARAELARVESFIARARRLPIDSKAHALLRAIQLVHEQAALGKTSGKVVIFTEPLTTQAYLKELLIATGSATDQEITLFNGSNDSPRASEALQRWRDEVGGGLPSDTSPSDDVALRLALVHEFRTRSRILISTEAGAKGLNLQFCDTVVNYDLPWNPQRIEQRIGRCHRYGQRRDVTVINFIARDNEAQQLTFEILSQKLDLFGMVLGATDEVLHRPGELAPESLASAIGVEFETQLRRIYERARTLDEVALELRNLRDSLDGKRRELEAAQRRTATIIQNRFDSTVRAAFRRIQDELPSELHDFDAALDAVASAYLTAIGAGFTRRCDSGCTELHVEDHAELPDALRGGVCAYIGAAPVASSHASLHLGHPLVQAAIEHARSTVRDRTFWVTIQVSSANLHVLRGKRGRLRVVCIRHRSFETAEDIIPIVVIEGDAEPLPAEQAAQLLAEQIRDRAPGGPCADIDDVAMTDAVDEMLFVRSGEAASQDQHRFDRALEQIERFIGDRILIVESRRRDIAERASRAEAARDGASSSDQRDRADRPLRKAQAQLDELDDQITQLRTGNDESYQRWRQRVYDRRYHRPEIVTLLDAKLEIT